jgi:TatA/E family protein of Tat protein translocase
MFGTLGVSELIIIVVIVLIIFGAGRLPQIGEGLGKALKGFKKEVHEAPPPLDPNAEPHAPQAAPVSRPPIEDATVVAQPQGTPAQAAVKPTAPYQPGPELTPGTTAALMAAAGPQKYEPPRPKAPQPPQTSAAGQKTDPLSMEERIAHPPPPPRGVYPPVPPSAQPKPVPKRPSAVVNKDAVARVQAQQAALKAKAAPSATPSPQDMQSLGEGVGEALRTFRQAVTDVRGAIDPEMRTIQAEIDAAQKEIEQTVESAKQMPAVEEEPPKKTGA